jgi:methyl-accepting chemotaxis protein
MKQIMSKLKTKLTTLNIPLKFKLITGFAVIVIITGCISIISYVSLKDSIRKLDSLINATITANNIIKPAGELHGIISNYFVYKKTADKEKVSANLAIIRNSIKLLSKQVKDEDGLTELTSLNNLCQSYTQSATEAMNLIDNQQFGGQVIGQLDEIRKVFGFITDSVQQLIAIELNHYQKLKTQEDRRITLMGIIILTIIITTGVLAIIAAIIFSGRLAGTISKLAYYSRDIANGNLQIKPVGIHSNDEIAVLADSFNKMGQNLRELIGQINESSNEVASSAEFLTTGAQQSARASEQIAATIQQVSNGAAEQSGETQRTAQVIAELLDVNNKISESTLQVLTVAENASAAALEGNEKVTELINQINIIEKEISSIQSVTNILESRSHEIEDILQLIIQMAEQTNLLSLNASIEAARAGEYGRGFSVVAEEIRKLADGSSQAVNDISSLLHEIQNEFQQAAEIMTSGVAKVRFGTQIAGEAKISFEKIVNTSNDTNNSVKDISGEIQRMVAKLTKVSEMTESIATIAEESSASSQEVAASAEEQTAGLEEILGSIAKLSLMAQKLQAAVQRFNL